MKEFINFYLVLTFLTLYINGQRVAPGVPPQHYQQQQYQQVPQHQQYGQPQYQQVPVQQQVPQHHQQMPIIQQQVPVQQQAHPQQQQVHPQQQQVHPQQQQVHSQQVPVQHQVPPQQQGGHHHEHGRQQLLNAANVAQEAQHIAEHMDVPIDTSKMSEQELQFHYFKMHDADNNNKLDGCELIKSLIHWHEQGNKDKGGNVDEKVFKDEELVNLIDPILNIDDANKDGYIDYPEFIRAQQKAGGQAKTQA